MFYFFSLLSGILIAFMLAFNGTLAGVYGIHWATVIIHGIGLAFIAVIVAFKKENPFSSRYSWYLYTGGAFSVLITVLNNAAFGRISVSAILALVLLGQTVAALVMDQYGFMGMPKSPFSINRLAGLCFLSLGIITMIDNFELAAILMSLISGLFIVICRTLNAKLSILTSYRISTFFHNLIGFMVSIPILLLLGGNETLVWNNAPLASWYVYMGGIVAVTVVLITNIVVAKVPAFYLSLLVFVGQVFTGILIDIFLDGEFSTRNLVGGIIVTIGLSLNLMLDKKNKAP